MGMTDFTALKGKSKEELLTFLERLKVVEGLLRDGTYRNKTHHGAIGGVLLLRETAHSRRMERAYTMALRELGMACITYKGYEKETTRHALATVCSRCRNVASPAQAILVTSPHSGAVHYCKQLVTEPLINGGDGYTEDVVAALLDLYAIYLRFGTFEALEVLLIGDMLHSGVGRSLLFALQTLGAHVGITGPATVVPKEFAALGGYIYNSVDEAIGEIGSKQKKLQVIRYLPHTIDLVKEGYLPQESEFEEQFAFRDDWMAQLCERPIVIEAFNQEKGNGLEEMALFITIMECLWEGGATYEAAH